MNVFKIIPVLHVIFLVGPFGDAMEYYITSEYILKKNIRAEKSDKDSYTFYERLCRDAINIIDGGEIEYTQLPDDSFGLWTIDGEEKGQEELVKSYIDKNGDLNEKYEVISLLPDPFGGSKKSAVSYRYLYKSSELLDRYLKDCLDLEFLSLKNKEDSATEVYTWQFRYSMAADAEEPNKETTITSLDSIMEETVEVDFFDKYIKILEEYRKK